MAIWTSAATALITSEPGGTLTETSGPVEFAGTIIVMANQANSAGLGGDLCLSGSFTHNPPQDAPVPATGFEGNGVECDTFALEINLGAAWLTANPSGLVRITTTLDVDGDCLEVYLYDRTAGGVKESATECVQTSIIEMPASAASGSYYLDIVPALSFLNGYTSTVELIEGTGGGGGGDGETTTDPLAQATPAAPGQPRYQVFTAPEGSAGDAMFQGEFNIGFNPHSGKVMAMSSAEVFRITTPERLTPAQPASCDAQWVDVTTPTMTPGSAVAGLDPILWTDGDSGRTYASNFTGGANGEYSFTDDDGATWIPLGVSPPNGGYDHQTLGTGPYPADSPLAALKEATGFDPVYYCSQAIFTAYCQRSDDGGVSFGPGVPVYADSGVNPVDNQVLDQTGKGKCSSLHGHVRVALDGTVYLPTALCTTSQGGAVSTDAGINWKEFYVPGMSDTGGGSSDPSIAIDSAYNLYFCSVDTDGRAKASFSANRGETWSAPVDLGAALGITQAAFPNAIAGSAGRAACGFLGAKSTQTNWQSLDYDGVWYVYVATTYDFGATWTLVNAAPLDPAQGKGGICLSGQGCNSSPNNRNLLDFNEITLDDKGYVMYGYNDGCVSDLCDQGRAASDFVATMRIARQTGGKSLFDSVPNSEPIAPAASCLAATRDASGAHLSWKKPDHGGAAITGYQIYSVTSSNQEILVGSVGPTVSSFNDLIAQRPGAGVAAYVVKALNAQGPGVISNKVLGPGETIVPTDITPTSFTFPALTGVAKNSSVSSVDTTIAGLGTDVSAEVSVSANGFYIKNGGTPTSTAGTVVNGDTLRLGHMSAATGNTPTTSSITVGDYTTSFTSTTAADPVGPAPIVADLEADKATGEAPLTVAFDASGTTGGAAGLRYTFVYGNGQQSQAQTAASISYTYGGAGSFDAYVIVTDSSGQVDESSRITITPKVTVTVEPTDVTTAELSVSGGAGMAPLTVNFDASGSRAQSGKTIASYRFDFGDGSDIQTGTSATARHVYTVPGSYSATVTVTDNTGGTATDSETIEVTDNDITVAVLRIDGAKSGPAPLTVNFDGSDSVAKTGESIVSYSFDPDGSGPVDATTGSLATFSYTYTTPGSYEPTLTITDSEGATSQAKAAVTITPATTPAAAAPARKGGALGLLMLPLLLIAARRRSKAK